MRARILVVVFLGACSSAAPVDDSVAVTPASATVSGGKSAQFTAQSQFPVAWTASAGSIDASGLYTAPAAAGSYTVTATSTRNAARTASAAVTVVAIPAAPAITAPATATAGKSGYTASVTAQTGLTYAWTLSGGTIDGAATGASITFTAGAEGTAQLACTAKNSLGDAGPAGAANVSIVALPEAPAITAPSAATAGKSGYAASVTAVSGLTYSWTLSGGTFEGAAAGASVTFTAGAAGTAQLTCTATNAAGDGGPAGTASVSVVALPAAPVISAPAFATAGAAGLTASTPAEAGVTFAWSMTGGTITSAATGVASVTFTAGAAGAATLSCTGTNAAGDSGPAGTAQVEIVAPAETPDIAAPASVTRDRTGFAASIAPQAGMTYAWTIEGGSITSGAAASSITFSSGAPGTLLLHAQVIDAAGAGVTGTATVAVEEYGLSLVAGTLGGPGNLDGTGSAARFSQPLGIALGPDGTAWVGDALAGLRTVTPGGVVTTVSPRGDIADGPDGGVQTVGGVAVAADGTVLFTEFIEGSLQSRSPAGVYAHVTPPGTFTYPGAVALSPGQSRTLVIASGHLIEILPDGGLDELLDGGTAGAGFGPDGGLYVGHYPGPGHSNDVSLLLDDGSLLYLAGGHASVPALGTGPAAGFFSANSFAFNPAGEMRIADTYAILRAVAGDPGQWNTSIFAGEYTGQVFGGLYAISATPAGDLLATDLGQVSIHKIAADGTVSTFAGNPGSAHTQDGQGAAAGFNGFANLIPSADGVIYLVDGSYEFRQIDAAGNVTSPDTDGLFGNSSGLALVSPGKLLASANCGIWTVEEDGGTWAGTQVLAQGQDCAASGTDGEGPDATFANPGLLSPDGTGNFYLYDGCSIRVLAPLPDGGWSAATAVGQPTQGDCQLTQGQGLDAGVFLSVMAGAPGAVYFADTYPDQVIWQAKLNGGTGQWDLSAIAGHAADCPPADGLDAGFCSVGAIAWANGGLYVSDSPAQLSGSVVRKLTQDEAGAWSVITVAGARGSNGVKPGPLPASFGGSLLLLAPTPSGDLLVGDEGEHSVLLLRAP